MNCTNKAAAANGKVTVTNGMNGGFKWLMLFLCTLLFVYLNIFASLTVQMPYRTWYSREMGESSFTRPSGYHDNGLWSQIYRAVRSSIFGIEILYPLQTHTNLTWVKHTFETLDKGIRQQNDIHVSRAFFEGRSRIPKIRLFTMDTVRQRNGTFFCLIWTKNRPNKPQVEQASLRFLFDGHVNTTINGKDYVIVNYDCPINDKKIPDVTHVTLLPVDYKLAEKFDAAMKTFEKKYKEEVKRKAESGKKKRKLNGKSPQVNARKEAKMKAVALRNFQVDIMQKELKHMDISSQRKTPVTYPVQSEKFEHEFGLCVSILHGTFTDDYKNLLIEWFEFHLLLGVTEFNIYNGTLRLEPDIHKIFEYYINSGVLLFHKQAPPIVISDGSRRDAALLTRMNTFQECINNNMHRYRFLVVVDNDEIIVPHKHNNYKDMMQDLREQRGIEYGKDDDRSFLFESMDFYGEFHQMANESQLSVALRYQNYVSLHVRPKSIHNPRLCMRLNPHMCRERSKFGGGVERVNITYAAVHHYRRTCPSSNNPVLFSKEACEKYKQQQQRDTSVLRFKDDLLRRLMKVHKELGFL